MIVPRRMLVVALGNGIKNYNKIPCKTIGIYSNNNEKKNNFIITKTQYRYYKNFGHKERPATRLQVQYLALLVGGMIFLSTAYFW